MPGSTRPTWHEYFMRVAELASTRSTCDRAHVGCVLVHEKNIIATGYNGSAPGMPHCADEGCHLEGRRCQRTIHAEVNAIGQAARRGVETQGAEAYVTHTPCLSCCKALVAAGISRVYSRSVYGDHATLALKLYGLEVLHDEQ